MPAAAFIGDNHKGTWLPNKAIAQKWMQYRHGHQGDRHHPPPAPKDVKWTGRTLTWTAEADLESGISHFIIFQGSRTIATVPEQPSNRFGRPLFKAAIQRHLTVPLAKWNTP